ncbi:MAG TPA: alpha/beta hydrolase-fold protein, partial [Gaiellaceae bacterium]|nr:alpha/beta hydrolase-fold protein [Gaiellaceae bacterium]
MDTRSSPTIEPLEDGRYRVTVSYHDPAAEALFIVGGLGGDEDPEDRRMRRDTDGWWVRSFEIAGGARLAYWFTTEMWPTSTDQLISDPLNASTHTYPGDEELPDENGFVASLVELPGARELSWSTAAGAPAGEVDVQHLASEILGNERRVWTYRPPGYDPSRAYPLVVCFDGRAYTLDAYVPLPTVLDNLIAAGEIPPVVVVLPDSLDQETRTRELSLDEPFVRFVSEELLPWAHARLSIDGDPARTVVAGSSLGGLAAAFCGLRRPDLFGLVLSQSGAYQFVDFGGPALFAVEDRVPLRLYLDVGLYEGKQIQANLHMRDVLVAKGYDVDYRTFPGGHDYFW